MEERDTKEEIRAVVASASSAHGRYVHGVYMHGDLGPLFEAVAAAQAEMSPAVKDSQAHYGSYADIASVIKAGAPVAKHGIAVMQPIVNGKENPAVVTVIGHSSGAYLAASLEMSKKPHDDGKATTYSRRYSQQGALNIPATDDDGQAQQRKAEAEETSARAPKQNTPPAQEAAPKESSQKDLADLAIKRIKAAKSVAELDKVGVWVKAEGIKGAQRTRAVKAYAARKQELQK